MDDRPYPPFALALGLFLPGSLLPQCRAGKVKVWHHNMPAHYERAQWKGVALSSEGALRLARQLRPLTALDATHVWDLAEDGDGNLYAATGDEGKVYKVGADGKAAGAYAGGEGQVLCLAVAADNAVYAGTGPAGHVVRIDPNGGAKLLCDTGEAYVWSLAIDPKTQTLYAGTGPHGRVYRVMPDGKANLFYQTKQEHILCLAAGEDGCVYAGTDKGGLLYRIDGRGNGFVRPRAAQPGVRPLGGPADGIPIGPSPPTQRRPGGPPPGGGASSAEGKEPARAGTGAPPTSGENSVYHVAPDGAVRE